MILAIDNKTKKLVTQQKTEQSFWRGFGGRNRHPIGDLGENPPIDLASLYN